LYKKILFSCLVLILLSVPIYAQEKLINNQSIDPFRTGLSNKEVSEDIKKDNKDSLGKIDLEVVSENVQKKELEEVLEFKGFVKYKNFKGVVLQLKNKTIILAKNEKFTYNNEVIQLIVANDKFILLNHETFKEYRLVQNKDIGGVKYSVEIKTK